MTDIAASNTAVDATYGTSFFTSLTAALEAHNAGKSA